MIGKKYPYGIDFQTSLAALYCQDPGFRKTYNDVVHHDYFDDDVLIHLVKISKRIFANGKLVTKQAIYTDFLDESLIENALPSSKKFKKDFIDTLDVVHEMSLEYLDYIPDKVVRFAQGGI